MASAEHIEHLERLRKQLQDYMAKQGLRSTGQRRVIVDTFLESNGHLSIEDLLALVREKEPRVGYATVYRTLKLLAACGVAHERHFGDGMTRYEVAHLDHHDHLICTECGKIEEFEDAQIEELQELVAKSYGFKVVFHKHELYGICSECQAKGKG